MRVNDSDSVKTQGVIMELTKERMKSIEEIRVKKNMNSALLKRENKISHKIYYPLSGRLQLVSKETFAKVNGKVYKQHKVKVKIYYPDNYPDQRRRSNREVLTALQSFRAFEPEGVFNKVSSVFKSFQQLAETINNISTLGEQIWEKTTKVRVLRIFSLLFRFINLYEKSGVNILELITILADVYAFKMEFEAEGVEDLAFETLLQFIPKKLREIITSLLTFQRRDKQINYPYLQYIGHIIEQIMKFLEDLPLPQLLKRLMSKLRSLVHTAVTHSVLSNMTDVINRYRSKPLILGDSRFWIEIEAIEEEIDPCKNSLTGDAVLDIIKHNPGARARFDAFKMLVNLKNQLKKSVRVEPCCFIFDGPPGLLKSVTLGKLLKLLRKTVYVHHVKSIMDGKDFYDRYDSQEIFYMDDVGQQGKSQWRNLINWVSCIPLPLDCAEASLKNTKLFSSEIIILTTNQFMDLHGFTAQDGISDPKALFRRAFVFDWSQVKNVDGQISGSVSLKKYNLCTSKWDVFNLKNLKGFLTFSNDDELLPWLASWILSLNEWKKKCQQNNEMTSQRIDHLRSKIEVVDFETESKSAARSGQEGAVLIQNNNDFVSDDEDEGEGPRMTQEEFDEYISPFITAAPSKIPGEDLGLGLQIPINPSLGSFLQEQHFEFLEIPTAEVNRGGVITVKYYHEALLEEWTFLDHLNAVISTIYSVLRQFVTELIAEIWATFKSPEFMMSIALYSLSLFLCALLIKVFEPQSFFGSSTELDWGPIEQLSKQSSSQNSAIMNSNLYEIEINKQSKMCCLCFDKYIIIPAHAISKEKATATVKITKVNKCRTVILEQTSCDVVLYDVRNDVCVLKMPKSHPLTFRDIKFAKTNLSNLVTPAGVIPTHTIKSLSEIDEIPYATKGTVVYSNVLKDNKELYTIHFKGMCGCILSDDAGHVGGMHVAGSEDQGLGAAVKWDQIIINFLSSLPRSYKPIEVLTRQEGSSGAQVNLGAYASVPTKSSIAPSPLYGIYEVDREPANLTKYGDRTIHEVFKKSLGKVVEPSEDEIKFGKEVMMELLSDFNIVSEDKVVKGWDNINGLNKKSSNGLGCLPNKEDYIDFDAGKLKDFFRDEISQIEKDILRGEVDWSKFVWFETLKDEIRNTEKLGEPRSFRVCTIHQQVLTKKYTAELVSKVMHNRLQNQIQIGCNPISEWPIMFNSFRGKNIFAGDIAKWDGSMLPSVQKAVNECILGKYKGPNKQVLAFLLDNLVNSLVVVKSNAFVTTHSMPSGSFLTAFYNSLVNRFYTAMWYKRHTPNALVAKFNVEILDYVYGDDKVVAVSPNRSDLTAVSMKDFFQSINMDFTDAEKKPICTDYQKISDISFLKRTFEYHNELKQIVCPLSLRTLKNTIAWVNKDKDINVVIRDKIGAVYRELYLHPERDSLMLEFRYLVESRLGPIKWLSRENLRELYLNDPTDYLIKDFHSILYN